jgi:PAS domain S-box-containing protein
MPLPEGKKASAAALPQPAQDPGAHREGDGRSAMKPGAGRTQTPARVLGETPAGAARDDAHAILAVKALCALIVTVGLLLIVVGLVQLVLGPLAPLARSRLELGGCLLAGGLAAGELARRGWRRSSAVLALLLALAALGLHAWRSGLGTHSLVLSGGVLLVALAGVLVDFALACVLAALNLALVGGLELAERSGAIAGAAVLPAVAAETRTLSYGMLAAAALIAAWVVRRQLHGNAELAREQERRMGRLLQLGSDFTWEMDAKARVTYLSPSFEQHTQRTIAEFSRAGTPAGPLIVDDAQWLQLQSDLRERRAYRDRVIHFVCKDGTEIYLCGSGEPVFDARGRCTGWWGVSRNATAEMQAQRALERSQAMLDRLVRLSPDAICVASMRDGRILLANPAFLQLAGRPEEEVVGHNGFELGLWRDEESMFALGRAIRAQGGVRDFRTVAWRPDGEARSVLITAASFDWDGEEVAVITTRDVSEIERAKQEADAILDNAVVGVCLVRAHRLDRVNPQLERMLGLEVGSLEGKSTEVLFPDRRRFDEFIGLFETKQAAGETIDIERKAMRSDGKLILIRMRGRAVDPLRRRETGTIWVIEDITERRRAELELAEAKREAEAASHAKSRFLATMSHEIRTPLSGVLGLARLLQDPGLGESRRRDYLGHLVDAAELLTGIVSDVLDLSKIEAGQLQVERIAFDLHGVVASTFRTFAPLGRERGLQMHCHIAQDAPRDVLGDPVRVRQILSNYLSNALKFTDRGRIDLHLVRSARTGECGAGGARIEVRDSGIGVPSGLRDVLFLPFTQADSSTTRRFGGSGLGLSICRELATLMGGEVGCDSDGVHGSTFWVELPLHPAQGEDMTLPGALAVPAQPLLGMRVLLAEDNPVNRLIVGAMLGRLGADVVEAEDGAHAVRVASRATPTLHAVLMDLHMPEIDGLEATRLLRAQEATAHLPVIALSAAVLDAERAQAQAAGMNGFLAKPTSEADLLRVLWPFAPPQPGWPTS